MIRVVIVDDQELVRSGLQLVLEARGCEVVGVAGDGRKAVDVIRRTEPDVALMDIRMPVRDGIAATRELTAARVRMPSTRRSGGVVLSRNPAAPASSASYT